MNTLVNPPRRYTITINGVRTSVLIEAWQHEMISKRLRHDPNSLEARIAVRVYLEEVARSFPAGQRKYMSRWIRNRIARDFQ